MFQDKQQQPKQSKFGIKHSRVGNYHTLVRDHNRGVAHLLTLGPNYICFFSFFLIVNILSIFLLHRLNSKEEGRLYHHVYMVIIIYLDICWLACALINPGIATQQQKTGMQTCQQCYLRYYMIVPKKQGRVHCRNCEICIDGYKHHCLISGNCVGKNNFIVSYFLLLGILLWIIDLAATLPFVYYI